jgi:hypothetical protein
MYTETKDIIIRRVERMADRFANADKPIRDECAVAITLINECTTIAACLEIEKELVNHCNQKFPIDVKDIDAGLDFGEWKGQHSDADYTSPFQKKA